MGGAVRQQVERLVSRWGRGVDRVRQRPLIDHLWRARQRYTDVYGGRLAAAIAYYGFFAAFALAVCLFAVLGVVLRDNPTVTDAVQTYLRANLPQIKVAELVADGRRAGTVALIGLVLAGVGWVEALRSSQRAIWGLDQQPGHPVIRWLVDLAVLVALGILLFVSVVISSGLQDVLLRVAGQSDESTVRAALRSFGGLASTGVDAVLAAAVLAGVPRLRMPLWRLLPSTVAVVVGLWALKTIGRWYVVRTQHNPAYQLVAGAVGLLIFMYLFNQLVLHAAAFAATSGRGTVIDLAAGPRPASVPELPESADSGSGEAGSASATPPGAVEGRAAPVEPAGRISGKA